MATPDPTEVAPWYLRNINQALGLDTVSGNVYLRTDAQITGNVTIPGSVDSHVSELGKKAVIDTVRQADFNKLKTNEDELLGHALSRRVEIAYFGENIVSYDQTGDIVVEEMRKAKAAKKAKTKKVAE